MKYGENFERESVPQWSLRTSPQKALLLQPAPSTLYWLWANLGLTLDVR